MDDPEDIRTIVFCQYWEFRMEEFMRLFDSPLLTEAERTAVYDDLQAAKKVFDPDGHGFTHRIARGVWFDYLDLPISTENEWIINTHTTNLANVGWFARLAAKRGRTGDYDWWRRLFLEGRRARHGGRAHAGEAANALEECREECVACPLCRVRHPRPHRQLELERQHPLRLESRVDAEQRLEAARHESA